MVLVPVSPGELLDKISILQIKRQRIRDSGSLENVNRELSLLIMHRNRELPNTSGLAEFQTQLDRANRVLWDVEDQIRRHERDGDFGPIFVKLARLVYRTNDERAAAKRSINKLFASEIVEEKCYVNYG